MELTAVLSPAEEGGYVAFNTEAGTTTEGESIEAAFANLREATTRRAARGCCCSCANNANKMAAPAPPPNPSCVWGLQPMKATKASGPWRGGSLCGGWSGRSRRRGYR